MVKTAIKNNNSKFGNNNNQNNNSQELRKGEAALSHLKVKGRVE